MADEGAADPKEERRKERKRRSKAESNEVSGDDAPQDVYILMENLLDQLKMLDYDSKFCPKYKFKPLSRLFFATATDASAQVHYFTNLISWLLSIAGENFDAPEQYDDPNTTITNVLIKLREIGSYGKDLSSTTIRTGSGTEVILILAALAQRALKSSKWRWNKPVYPNEADEVEEEGDTLGDSEISNKNGDEEDEIEDDLDDFYEEDGIPGQNDEAQFALVPEPKQQKQNIMKAEIDAAAWRIEVERVMPQLKVQLRSDDKDWRGHIEKMTKYQNSIQDLLVETQSHLDKLQNDIGDALVKIESREKSVNSQLDNIVTEFRQQQDTLADTNSRYKQSSTTVVELTRKLALMSDELDQIRSKTDERGNRMTDSGPLVRIKQALTRLKKEVSQMDLRIGVLQHSMLMAKTNESNKILLDMNSVVDH
eukprot:m.60116 g.60116  ORF g.60116 m.60116 type:complete len:425 (+) comp22803_c0_seq1:247-1521(+)